MSSFSIDKSQAEEAANEKKYAEGQKWVFFATFVNYAMAHWTRK
jgi:hypothetical protein